MLKRNEAVLVFIDVQGKLHERMYEKAVLDGNLERLIQCAKGLGLPCLGSEQIPGKLGATNEPFKTLLAGSSMIGKTAFSCCEEPQFMAAFEALERRQAILVGIETHICIYQTAIDLLEQGVDVFVVADAVSSRDPKNKALALQAMRDAGATILPTEAVLFALLRDAADPQFKRILRLIK